MYRYHFSSNVVDCHVASSAFFFALFCVSLCLCTLRITPVAGHLPLIHHIPRRTGHESLLRHPRFARSRNGRVQLDKLLPRHADIHLGRIEAHLTRRQDGREIGILRQATREQHEAARLDLEVGELRRRGRDTTVLGEGMLMGLEDGRQALVAVRKGVPLFGLARRRRDGQTRRPLIEHELARANHLGQPREQTLDRVGVGHQRVDHRRPRAIQALVPDGGGVEGDDGRERLARPANHARPLRKQLLPQVPRHEIHLVQQHEDPRAGAVLPQRAHHRGVVAHVGPEVPALDVEDEDQHRHVGKDVLPLATTTTAPAYPRDPAATATAAAAHAPPLGLRRQIALHEGIVAPAVPQVQREIAHEADVRVFHVDGGAQPAHVPGHVVGEDDGPHRGFARAGLAHEQDFAVFGFFHVTAADAAAAASVAAASGGGGGGFGGVHGDGVVGVRTGVS